MTGKNRIMIYGFKADGAYVVEFRTSLKCFGKDPHPWGDTGQTRRSPVFRPPRSLQRRALKSSV
jgi:hypothetical protein